MALWSKWLKGRVNSGLQLFGAESYLRASCDSIRLTIVRDILTVLNSVYAALFHWPFNWFGSTESSLNKNFRTGKCCNSARPRCTSNAWGKIVEQIQPYWDFFYIETISERSKMSQYDSVYCLPFSSVYCFHMV